METIYALNSYSEYSPSGEGIRIFTFGYIDRGFNNQKKGVEMYSTARYLTVTGNHLELSPTYLNNNQQALTAIWNKYKTENTVSIEKIAEVTKQITTTTNGPWTNKYGDSIDTIRNHDQKLNRLLNGDNNGYPSPSEADMATMQKLYFYAYEDGDIIGITREYRKKGRKNPGKLDRDDYLIRTLAKIDRTEQIGGPLNRKVTDELPNIQPTPKTEKINPEQFFTIDSKGKIKAFIPKRLADHIKSTNHFMTPYGLKQQGRRSRIYTYHPDIGTWFPDGVEQIDQISARALGNLYKSYYVDETVKLIRKTTLKLHFPEAPINLIGMKNGVYDLNTDELIPFSPTHYLKQSLPVTYDPTATCTKIDEFLDQTAGKYKPTMYELLGYSLYRDYIYAVIFIFLGEGDNGKTTFLNLFTAFLGRENISNVTMQQLSKNTFAAADLYGKNANLCDDIPANPIKVTGHLKMLTGKGSMRGEFKNQDAFDFVNYAVLVFTCNELPPSYDNTDAWFKRPMIIEFQNKFVRGTPECDPNILKKIVTQKELSGLFNKSIQALKNLLETHRFTNEKGIDQKHVEYTLKSNPAQYFIETFIEPNPTGVGHLEKSVVYREYVKFTRDILSKRPTSDTHFGRLFKIYAPGWSEDTLKVDTGKKREGKKIYKNTRVWYYVQLNREKLRAWINPTTF